ncbi:heavy metal translocating P-type ATPase [Ralstonia pickettii]|uniref:P-type Zn(2+) transporter n=1 Tax=Ralstonia pickettii TaxID=329 RepID=A0A7X2HLE3_RALPI|nr:cation-translocating P-type ATPase [Ralstonia pickettii]MRS98039.1 heavy metal translocating P-type ATPase [Ralstonia pickettii]
MDSEPARDKAAGGEACGNERACDCGATTSVSHARAKPLAAFSRTILWAFGLTIAVVVLVVVGAEQLGLLDALRRFVPWPVWLLGVVAGGWPIFRNVLSAALRRKITSHTLMTLGLVAAVVAGAWPAAILIVFFMRLADYIEHFTGEHARQAVRDLTALAPETARVERDGGEVEVPIGQVQFGEIVVIRPGEKIPVDGHVIAGQATVNQAAITGESMPVEAGPGTRVFAASFAQLGHLRVRVTAVGADSTFGRVIQLVEQAEQHRAGIQLIADRFATWYLPVVATVAATTFFVSGNMLATAAVLMVACSCSFAIATPVAMIASIGAAARRGLLIKGGKYLEALARASVVVLDKTGTLTLGRPAITDVIALDAELGADQVLALAATAERYSEHPLADAVRVAATESGLRPAEPEHFEAMPGSGVRVRLDGATIVVGSARVLEGHALPPVATELEAQGKTLLFVLRDGRPIGVLAAMDTLRPDVPEALAELRQLGIEHIELLTGDNARTAAAIAQPLGIDYRAGLLPEDKIAVVKEYQRRGHVVVMIGDGVNDAPALAQADVGIAMGAAGSPIAIEAAHIALMREDWSLVPEVLRIARRTMNTVKINIGFTAIYNLTGLALASLGFLPPAIAAAAQAGPDFGILANSARLLRPGQRRGKLRQGQEAMPAEAEAVNAHVARTFRETLR